jgi:UDP-N-acetylglucosamine 2-epimerase (non-hydrolysing)
VTHSGGIQEEACIVRTQCVTLRRNTERQVTVEVGSNRLVAADQEAVSSGLAEALAGR